jgi:hypothetical protein
MSEHNEHGHPRVEAMPDKPRSRWLLGIIGGLLVAHLVGLLAFWLFFQRQSESVVATQVLQKAHLPLLELQQRERERLTTYGVVDAEKGLYRVPVDRGIDLYLETVRARVAAGEPLRIGAAVPPIGAPAGATDPVPVGGPGAAGTGASP